GKCKGDGHAGLKFDRVVQRIWVVDPLLHGRYRRRNKSSVPRLESEIDDLAPGANGCVEHDCTFDSKLLRSLWVDRLNHPHQALSGLHLRNTHMLAIQGVG